MKKVIGCSLVALLSGVIVSDAEGMRLSRSEKRVEVSAEQLAVVKEEAVRAVNGGVAVAAAADLAGVEALPGLHANGLAAVQEARAAQEAVVAAADLGVLEAALPAGAAKAAVHNVIEARDLGALDAALPDGSPAKTVVREVMRAFDAVADATDLGAVEALPGLNVGGLAAVQEARATQEAVAAAADLARVEALPGLNVGGLVAVQEARETQEAVVAAADLGAVEALPGLNVGGLAAVQRAHAIEEIVGKAFNNGFLAGRGDCITVKMPLIRIAGRAANPGLAYAMQTYEQRNDSGVNAANAGIAFDDDYAAFVGRHSLDAEGAVLNTFTPDAIIQQIVGADFQANGGAILGDNPDKQEQTLVHLLRLIADLAENGVVPGAAAPAPAPAALGYGNVDVLRAIAKVVNRLSFTISF